MIKKLTQYMQPPVSPGEDEKTHRAALLNLALINIITLMPVLILVTEACYFANIWQNIFM